MTKERSMTTETPARKKELHHVADRATDPKHFRTVMGHLPTGVAIVSGLGADHTPVGLTVGSFSSVSLDPPLVAFYAMKGSKSFDEIREAGSFVANILGSRTDYYCRAFSREREHRFGGIDWSPSGSGAPILAEASAWVDCSIDRVEEVGDHYWVVGKVHDLDIGIEDHPLLFFKGRFGKPVGLADPRARWMIELHDDI